MHVLSEIERHLRRTGVSASRFGLEVARDPRLVFDIRNGRSPRDELERRIRDHLRQEKAR